MTGNEGIIIHGGQITAKQIAVGEGAAIKTINVATESLEQRGLNEIGTRLQDATMAALQEPAEALDSSPAVLQDLEEVARELTQPQPNKPTIQARLDSIADVVKPVGSIATAVGALRQAVLNLL